MSAKSKKNKSNQQNLKPFIMVDPSLGSFEGNAFFQKKLEKAKEVIKKVGIPKQFAKKKSK